jgi:hypothetical protein
LSATGTKSFVIGSRWLNRARAARPRGCGWRTASPPCAAAIAWNSSRRDRADLRRRFCRSNRDFLPADEFAALARPGQSLSRWAARDQRGRHDPAQDRARPANLAALPALAALAALAGMARPDPLYRQPRRRAGGVDPEHPAPRLRRPARSADRAARRHLSPDGQGVAVPDRCRGRCRPVHLCAGIAPADPGAARLGAADEPRRARSPIPRTARARSASTRRIAALGLPEPRVFAVPANTLSSPTPSAFTRAARAPAARCASRSGPMAGAARSCRGPGFDPWSGAGAGAAQPDGWQLGDLLERAGIKPHRWRAAAPAFPPSIRLKEHRAWLGIPPNT